METDKNNDKVKDSQKMRKTETDAEDTEGDRQKMRIMMETTRK